VRFLSIRRGLVANHTELKSDFDYSGIMPAMEIPLILYAGPALLLSAVLVCLILALNFD
jgi:hypothetical protein